MPCEAADGHSTTPSRRSGTVRACRRLRAVGLVCGMGLVVVGLTGCRAFSDWLHRKEPGPHAIALHRLADTGVLPGALTLTVADPSGTERVCIRSSPIVSNRHVQSARIEETGDPQRPALRLLLDRQGTLLWHQACQEAPGDSVAVLLDGFFWHRLALPRPTEPESILLQGRIGRSEAEAIVKSIPKQYRRLNP